MKLTPSLDEVLEYAGPATHVALSVEVLADSETPISLFGKLAGDRPGSFLLESVGGGEQMGRYSFIGSGVEERFEFRDNEGTWTTAEGTRTVTFDDPLEPVRERLRGWKVWTPRPLPRLHGGAVGYLGFDCVRYFERIPLAPAEGLGLPDGVLLFCDAIAIYDHFSRRLILVVHAPLEGDREAHYCRATERMAWAMERLASQPERPAPVWLLDAMPGVVGGGPPYSDDEALPAVANRTREDMENAVRQARAAIENGEVFQVVISQRLSIEADVEPMALYRALRALNPSPYMFFFRFERHALVGASPEVLVRLEDERLLLRPIAGTRPRGRTEAEEAALEAELLADDKELAEHRMLVDLGRNDLGRIARIGSVRVERPLHVERYSHVMHLVTDVVAELEGDRDCFDALRATFPAGTVSGAPKIRACSLLAELEPDRRGFYAGAVGYFGVQGSMDMCIAIRSLVVEPGRVHAQAGAGIVFDSVPEREYAECLQKAEAGLAAVRLALRHGAGGPLLRGAS